MKEIFKNCRGSSLKTPTKLQQIILFLLSKKCKTTDDLVKKLVELTRPIDKEKIQEKIIYSKCSGVHYLKKHLKKKGLLYQYNKERREYRFDCLSGNYVFHHIVYNQKDRQVKKKFKLLLPYLYEYNGINFLNNQEIDKYEHFYNYVK